MTGRRPTLSALLLGVTAGLAGVPARAPAEPLRPPTDAATALCLKDGAKIEAETAPNGQTHAVCVFPSGARLNAWAYFRNKHRTLR